jgi:ubiquinone/menaquinone biosynthesis C-methylase UbiE
VRVNSYSALAAIYSHLMKSIDYGNWADYLFNLSKDVSRECADVLEIACGTGIIAGYLSKKYQRLTVCDKSADMLKQIDNPKLKPVCCDMSELPFKQKFDFIYSTFDSVNYLLSKEKVVKMLKSVSRILADDGIYAFDVSMEKNSVRYQRYLNRKGKYQKIAFTQKSLYNDKTRIHYNAFEITLPDGTQVQEMHKQKIYTFEDYFRFIDATDFYVHKCYEAFSYKDANENTERIQFLLKKKHANI